MIKKLIRKYREVKFELGFSVTIKDKNTNNVYSFKKSSKGRVLFFNKNIKYALNLDEQVAYSMFNNLK